MSNYNYDDVTRNITGLNAFLAGGRNTDYGNGEFRMSGHEFAATNWRSRLPRRWNELYSGHAQAGQVRYVVCSYNTPIAWVQQTDDGYAVWIPEVTYGSTTRNHQQMTHYALKQWAVMRQATVKNPHPRVSPGRVGDIRFIHNI